MIPRVTETREVVVGRYYLVPHLPVRGCFDRKEPPTPRWLPVLGGWHRDPEIGAGFLHVHHDPRFISSRLAVACDMPAPETPGILAQVTSSPAARGVRSGLALDTEFRWLKRKCSNGRCPPPASGMAL